jgi:hypothetical protein
LLATGFCKIDSIFLWSYESVISTQTESSLGNPHELKGRLQATEKIIFNERRVILGRSSIEISFRLSDTLHDKSYECCDIKVETLFFI